MKAPLQAGALVDEAKHAGYAEYFELTGDTALLSAARAGHADAVEVLLSVGACQHACKYHFRTVVVRGWSGEWVHEDATMVATGPRVVALLGLIGT